MITIKTNTVLKDFEGVNLKNGDKDLTVGGAISTVLGGQVENPYLGWMLGKKFATSDKVELSAEDVVFIKDEMKKNKHWIAVVTGQILALLEGKEDGKKE